MDILDEQTRRGRPRVVGIACPKCGMDSLICRSTKPRGNLVARYYRCRVCGHRGILVSGADKDWWKDAGNLPDNTTGCS